jgi:hypothetical protein
LPAALSAFAVGALTERPLFYLIYYTRKSRFCIAPIYQNPEKLAGAEEEAQGYAKS